MFTPGSGDCGAAAEAPAGTSVAAASTNPAANESFANISSLHSGCRSPVTSHPATSEPRPVDQTAPERSRNGRFIDRSRTIPLSVAQRCSCTGFPSAAMSPVGSASPTANVTPAQARARSPFHAGPAHTLSRDIRGRVHDGPPELVEEIIPLGVHALDQPQLPRAVPFLETLFAQDRRVHCLVHSRSRPADARHSAS